MKSEKHFPDKPTPSFETLQLLHCNPPGFLVNTSIWSYRGFAAFVSRRLEGPMLHGGVFRLIAAQNRIAEINAA